MSFIQGLHGVVAIVLLCSLLFVEEVGVPLPIPGELTLIAAGILIAAGGLDPWLFVPLAVASCLAGSVTGYSWARLVGEHGLRAAAARLHQTRRLDRVTVRLKEARPLQIAFSRLLPGFRVYTTLVAGAGGVDRSTFLIGVGPATVVWVAIFLVLGVVAGVPVERLLGQVQGLLLQGGVLIVLGVGTYFGIRRVPEHSLAAVAGLSPGLRALLAAGVDVAMIGTVVAGVLAIVRPLTSLGATAGWLDILVVVIVIVGFYSVATRAGRRATPGERLLDASYLTQRSPDAVRRNLRALARVLVEGATVRPRPDVVRVAAMFRTLGHPRRLRVAQLLLAGDRSPEEVAGELQLPAPEAVYTLKELEIAGVAVVRATAAGERYAIASDHIRIAVAEMLDQAEPGEGLA